MAYTMRPATPKDLISIVASRRRQRVLRLNPPYTLVIPEALLTDLVRSQVPVKPKISYVFVCVEQGSIIGYVQARCRWRRTDEWTITTLSTTQKDPEPVWRSLLEEVCRAAGEEGVIRMFAKIPQDAPLAEIFRSLGFSHYANERIWGNLYCETPGPQVKAPPFKPLRGQKSRDAWDLLQLYRAVTPPVPQHA